MTVTKAKSGIFKTRFSVDGVRIQESTGFRTKKEAVLYEKKREQEVKQEMLLGVKPKKTWEEACARWCKEMAHKRTIRQDMEKIRWLNLFLRGKHLDDITKEIILLITAKKEKTKVTASTVNRTLAFLRAILNRAQNEWEWLNRVPSIKLKQENPNVIRYLTQEEAVRLLGELPQHLRLMAKFSLATGLRQANVTKLTWAEVHETFLIIPASKFKTKKPFNVPLNRTALEVLNEVKNAHPTHVFTYRNRPVTQVSTKAWFKALKRAGIDDFRWHDLRHTWASWHVQNGTSLQELQALGGWSSFQMVLRYAHLCPDNLRTASERVNFYKG